MGLLKWFRASSRISHDPLEDSVEELDSIVKYLSNVKCSVQIIEKAAKFFSESCYELCTAAEVLNSDIVYESTACDSLIQILAECGENKETLKNDLEEVQSMLAEFNQRIKGLKKKVRERRIAYYTKLSYEKKFGKLEKKQVKGDYMSKHKEIKKLEDKIYRVTEDYCRLDSEANEMLACIQSSKFQESSLILYKHLKSLDSYLKAMSSSWDKMLSLSAEVCCKSPNMIDNIEKAVVEKEIEATNVEEKKNKQGPFNFSLGAMPLLNRNKKTSLSVEITRKSTSGENVSKSINEISSIMTGKAYMNNSNESSFPASTAPSLNQKEGESKQVEDINQLNIGMNRPIII